MSEQDILTNRTAEILASEWLLAKEQEEFFNRQRIEVEQELINLLGQRVEGAETHSLDGYKVVITGKVTRTVDPHAWDVVAGDIDFPVPPVKTVCRLEADVGICRVLAENHPHLWSKVATAITTRPAKTAVKVERQP